MTFKELLETGYGIDFDSLQFKTKPDACSVEEIKNSLATNEIVATEAGKDAAFDFDIVDADKKTILYFKK